MATTKHHLVPPGISKTIIPPDHALNLNDKDSISFSHKFHEWRMYIYKQTTPSKSKAA